MQIDYSDTVLIVPPNDAEAVMITKIAEKMGLPMILSHQLHGASLDAGHDYVAQVKQGGYTKAVIVEMPGVKSEAELRKMGVMLEIIDHHHYTDLDRAHGAGGELLLSSLEQFLDIFHLDDVDLKRMGFSPRLVRGIGIQDRGYVWALYEEGYSKREVKKVLAYMDELTAHLHNPKTEAKKNEQTRAAWERRKKWRDFWIVESRANFPLRPRLSRLIAEEVGKPTALIILERARNLIYVQESDYAMELFERFGGFTFGVDRNWGHRNDKEGKKVTLRDVKRVIEEIAEKG